MLVVERTPNPRTRKFIPFVEVSERPGSYEPNARTQHEVLNALFTFAEVREVYVGRDFVSVTIDTGDGWERYPELQSELAAVIESQVESFWDLIPHSKSAGAEHSLGSDEDSEVVRTIKELLDTRIRPAVAHDGGDILFSSFKDGVLSLEMKGACSGCPSSTATLKHGIQGMLRYFVPEVVEVRAV